MKKSRYSEEQSIGILKEHEAGVKTTDLCRKHGVSPATFYTWKGKYGGMEVSEAKRLKQLQEENAKLKRVVADLTLDDVVLKDLVSKNCRACGPSWSSCPCNRATRDERAKGMQASRHQPIGEAVSIAEAR